MSGLSDYLNSLNRERKWSTRRIEQEAKKHGHAISYASASRYLNGTHPKTPSAETLQAFADVFGVDVNKVRRAALRPGIGEPLDLGPESGRLTGPQREAIRHVVRVMLEQNNTVADLPQRDDSTTRPSAPRLTLLSDDAPEGLEDMPYAADRERPGDDPGEDDH